jgi:hypothetical protein
MFALLLTARKCNALEFVTSELEVGTFPIWKGICLEFTEEMLRSLNPSDLLAVIIWDQEKKRVIDIKDILMSKRRISRRSSSHQLGNINYLGFV